MALGRELILPFRQMQEDGNMGPPVTTHAAHGLQHHQRKDIFLYEITATRTIAIGPAAVGTLVLPEQHDDLPQKILEANERGVLIITREHPSYAADL